MLAGIGVTGFLLIILVALLLFGPQKLPELGRAVGNTLREFKKGTNDIMEVASVDKEEKDTKEKI